jgi:hypothetical protein
MRNATLSTWRTEACRDAGRTCAKQRRASRKTRFGPPTAESGDRWLRFELSHEPKPAHRIRPEAAAQANLFRVFRYRRFRDWKSRHKPVEEKRKHPRTEVNEPAYVSSGGSVMSCVVRNISVEGAAIDVENPSFVPPQFRLVLAKDSSVRECRVAWIQRNRIGLTFVETP